MNLIRSLPIPAVGTVTNKMTTAAISGTAATSMMHYRPTKCKKNQRLPITSSSRMMNHLIMIYQFFSVKRKGEHEDEVSEESSGMFYTLVMKERKSFNVGWMGFNRWCEQASFSRYLPSKTTEASS
jgi:hypothetical protein